MTLAVSIAQGGSNNVTMRNRIINGGMMIFQRGTAATADSVYSVDRWRFVKGNDATESTSQNTDAPSGFSYSLRNTISVGDASLASNQYSGFEQLIEGYNIADLAWGTANAKPVTLSFWVRSSVTGVYTGNLRNSDSTRINPFNFTVNSANTWEQKSITVSGDTGGTWQTTSSTGIIVAIYIALGSGYSGGTAGVWSSSPNFGCGSPVNGIASNGNIFAITGVQLEAGTTATAFEQRLYGTELALCQRYYEKSYDQAVVPGSANRVFVLGPYSQGSSTTSELGNGMSFKVEKRAAPSITLYDGAGASGKCSRLAAGVSWNDGSTVAVDSTSTSSVRVYSSSGASAQVALCHFTASAEL